MYQEYQECRAEEEMFDCGQGECALTFWKCDGFYDCNSQLDERNPECCASIQMTFDQNQMDRGKNMTMFIYLKYIASVHDTSLIYNCTCGGKCLKRDLCGL